MAADIDILKIDGKYRKFSIITKNEIFDNSDGYYDKQGVKYNEFGRPTKKRKSIHLLGQKTFGGLYGISY